MLKAKHLTDEILVSVVNTSYAFDDYTLIVKRMRPLDGDSYSIATLTEFPSSECKGVGLTHKEALEDLKEAFETVRVLWIESDKEVPRPYKHTEDDVTRQHTLEDRLIAFIENKKEEEKIKAIE